MRLSDCEQQDATQDHSVSVAAYLPVQARQPGDYSGLFLACLCPEYFKVTIHSFLYLGLELAHETAQHQELHEDEERCHEDALRQVVKESRSPPLVHEMSVELCHPGESMHGPQSPVDGPPVFGSRPLGGQQHSSQ